MVRRRLRIQNRLMWRRGKRFIIHSILHADDSPERLARGVAVGVFMTFTPTIGLQMILVVSLAWLLRANKIVGLPFVWITNPFTFVPIYYPMYVIGAMITGYDLVGIEWWKQLGHPPAIDWWNLAGMWEMFRFYLAKLTRVAVPLWVGSLLVSTVLGLLSYFVTLSFVRTYRIRHWGSVLPRALHKLTHPQELLHPHGSHGHDHKQ